MVKPITCNIDGVSILLRSFGEHLNCWGTQIGKTFLMRQGIIDTQAKAQEFLKALQELSGNGALRVAVEQLGLPESEWEQITAEHILLAWLTHNQGLSLQVAHLNLPTQPLYTPKTAPAKSEFMLRAVAQLPKLQNVDAWETYCYWLHEEMEKILEKIPLESMDEYTLQALLLDFVHEVRASLLLSSEVDVAETLLKEGALRKLLDVEYQGESIALEKILVKRRHEARDELVVQYETLGKMVSVIATIEKDHPEFISLKWQAMILERLLGSQLDHPLPGGWPGGWIEKLILLQLFHEALGIVSVVSCDTGWGRTHVAFAIQATVAILRQTRPMEKLLDMALHWNETVHLLDQAIAERGEHYLAGLNDNAMLVVHFRQLFVEVLERLCIPLTARSTHVPDLQWHQGQVENREVLDLFPPIATIDKEGRSQRIRLIKPMIKSGEPKELTADGHHLLTRLTVLP